MHSRPSRYGWRILAIAWLVYGLGIAPGYYSWGIFLPEILVDLDFDRGQGGLVFGVFTFFYSCLGPLVGWSLGRFGARTVITAGSLTAALGFLVVSQAHSLTQCLIGYSLLGGAGIGFSTILPTQTLATNWFVRQRARAMAIVMTAGGIVGLLVPRVDSWVLAHGSWRSGWLLIAGISVAVALLSALFVRNRPEDMGLEPDGGRAMPEGTPEVSVPGQASPPRIVVTSDSDPNWTASDALRTPQFLVLVLCGIAFAVPWGVVVSHGRLHLGDLGLSNEVVVAVIGTMILTTTVGRLAGTLGDFVRAQTVLGLALLIEAAGLIGLIYSSSPAVAYASTMAIAVGFGASYVSVSVVFGAFFGRRAFATTSGTRMMITGLFNAAMPAVAGMLFDRTGTYTPVFLGLATVTTLGGIAALRTSPPKPPETVAAGS